MDNSKTKANLRRHLLKSRRALSVTRVNELSKRIEERLCLLHNFTSATKIALYAHHANEVKTDSVLQRATQSGKEVYYPIVSGSTLQFYRVRTINDLSADAYGIMAPGLKNTERQAPVSELDIVVIPGIAFDEAGTRVGFGKGYYDRALSGLKAGTIVGLAYEFQIVSGWIPVEAHDIPVSIVVTEERVINLTASSGKSNRRLL